MTPYESIQSMLNALPEGSSDIPYMSFGLLIIASIIISIAVSHLYLLFFDRNSTGSRVYRAFPLMGPAITCIFLTVQFSLPLSLGLLGSGGSIVTVPVLVYLIGQDEKVAIAGSLFIVGAVHIAQALVPLARLLGYAVTLIDPRQAWTTQTRFADLEAIELSEQWPDQALETAKLDARCAVVTLSHDPKLDDPALRVALATPVFYIGCLGSRKTHAGRLERLRAEGFSDADLQRLHGPIGLDIGARSPAEIALSVMAEVTQTLRQKQDSQ